MQPSGDQTAPETVIFVGASHSFSSAFLRTIGAEFAELEPLRLGSWRDVAQHLKATNRDPRLVVVDAPLCHEFIDQGDDEGSGPDVALLGDIPVAVAYWDDKCAQLARGAEKAFAQLRGFVPMNQSLDIWLSVLRLLVSGGNYFPAELTQVRSILSGSRVADEPLELSGLSKASSKRNGKLNKALAEPLTPREEEVIQLVVQGKQNKQIAADLKLSSHTVKLHMHHIITKLGATNRTEAAMRYLAQRSE